MYKSTALLFMSLVSLSVAGTLIVGCRNFKTIQHFDPIKYFGKAWYAIYINENTALSTQSMTCFKNNFTLLDINVVREIGSAYIPQSFMYESYINLAHFTNGTGKYTGVSRIIDRDGRPLMKEFKTIQHYVIGTDYNNYSVTQSCARGPNGSIYSTYKILKRTPRDREITYVIPVLQEIGLSIFDFTPIHHYNCADGRYSLY